MDQDPVVILAALDLEFDMVRRSLDHWVSHPHAGGTWFESTTLPATGCTLVLGRTGVGNPAAAVVTDRAIAMFRPTVVLLVGIAGALHCDLRIGDVIVATKVYSYNEGLEDDEGFHARPQAWTAPYEWEQRARHIANAGQWRSSLPPTDAERPPQVYFRPVASGEVVLNSKESTVARRLRRNYNDAAAIEMESAGAAYASHLNSSWPMLTIRGISDLADGAKLVTDRQGCQGTAAAHAAAFALALAADVGRTNGHRVRRPVVNQVPPTRAGLVKAEFCRRLGDSWTALADLVGIPPFDRARFVAGEEGRRIWEWLEERDRLTALPLALATIDRSDLVAILPAGW